MSTPKHLSIGKMDRRIVLQVAPVVQSASGEETFDWDNAISETVWAEWVPTGTDEKWKSQDRLGAYVDGVFRIHDRTPRPTPNDTRILFDNRVFDIQPYVEVDRRRGLELPVIAHGEDGS